MMNKLAVAIDGPAGAGKSTVAKMVAAHFGLLYIDTGAMYRALTYKILRDQIDMNNEAAVHQILTNTTIELKMSDREQAVYLDHEDVTNKIRSREVNANVSKVAAYQHVREEMVRQQQLLAKHGDVIMDGRDIGTYVMPFAKVKIFLNATVAERAKRRHEENLKKGIPSDLLTLTEEIAKRDHLDATRAFAPLKKATDALEIDTTSMSIDEVVQNIIQIVEKNCD